VLDSLDCTSFDVFARTENELSWENTRGDGCDSDDVEYYNLFYKPFREFDFELLATIEGIGNRSFLHDSIQTYTGCYAVSAVDEAGNESAPSNLACNDNCEYFEMPNIFTPNEDGVNDFFTEMPGARYVESLSYYIHNRWGALVYLEENAQNVQWDGTNTNGRLLSDGVYYYVVKVTFVKLNPEDRVKDFKGWFYLKK